MPNADLPLSLYCDAFIIYEQKMTIIIVQLYSIQNDLVSSYFYQSVSLSIVLMGKILNLMNVHT